MNYDSMTVLQLKTLCKDRGLRVSGNKSEVIIRLMENDEAGMQPAPVAIQQTISPQQVQGGYGQPQKVYVQGGYVQPQKIYVQKEGELAEGIGIGIIIYAVFRIFWALIFSVGEGQAWLLSPVALILGLGFLLGGILTYLNYRNGILFTLGILGVSGILSVLFHGDEVNPVSIAWGDAMIMTSIMASVTCMIIVALPLILSTTKDGWPESINRVLNSGNSADGTKEIKCQACKSALMIPNDYSGKIECPSCKSQMNV